MTHLQPYPVSAEGRAGLSPAVLSPLQPREAVTAWCRAKGWGPFQLERRTGNPVRGAVLWEARWPLEQKRFRFVTT